MRIRVSFRFRIWLCVFLLEGLSMGRCDKGSGLSGPVEVNEEPDAGGGKNRQGNMQAIVVTFFQ